MDERQDMDAPVGSGSREPNPAASALSGFDPSREDEAESATLDEMELAFSELHGCMIRRPGDLCQVRKEYLATALWALDRYSRAHARAALIMETRAANAHEPPKHFVRVPIDLCDLATAIAEKFLCQPKEMPWEDRTDELASAVADFLLASGIEARSDETQSGSAEGKSPTGSWMKRQRLRVG